MKRIGIIIRQALHSFTGHKAFSVAQIAGTAISVAMVAVIVTFINMKVSDIYPEYSRTSIIRLAQIIESEGPDKNCYGGPGRKFVEHFMEGIPHIRKVSIVSTGRKSNIRQFTGADGRTATITELFVDKMFWDILGFEFISGSPIPDTGYDAVNPQAVICESAALALFGTSDATGCILSRDSVSIMVSGVVRDVSPVAENSFAHIWLPSEMVSSESQHGSTGLLEYGTYALCQSDGFSSNREIHNELEERLDVFNENNPYGISLKVKGFENSWTSLFGNDPGTTSGIFALYFMLVVVVPSLNALGLVSFRISRRREEFAIRRAYGAPGKSVIRQILEENLVFTSTGALLGLVMAFVFLKFADSIMYTLFLANYSFPGVFSVRPRDLIHTDVFEISSFFKLSHFGIIVFCVFVINIVSSLIPALRMVREDIVTGLNSKK